MSVIVVECYASIFGGGGGAVRVRLPFYYSDSIVSSGQYSLAITTDTHTHTTSINTNFR